MTQHTMLELPADLAAHHAWLISLTEMPASGIAADLGCGRGEDLRLLAVRHTGPAVRLVGVDISDGAAEGVKAAATADPRITFRPATLDERLPFDDASLDLVYSHNLTECLADPHAFAREIARVLRPGGQLVIAHWDWDSQVFDGLDKAQVRRLVAAYSDWQQAWMNHADGWMGRRLWGTFNATRCFEATLQARILVNTTYREPWFGYRNAMALASLVKRGLVEAKDYEGFTRNQMELQSQGRYVYSITGYAYVGYRRPSNE